MLIMQKRKKTGHKEDRYTERSTTAGVFQLHPQTCVENTDIAWRRPLQGALGNAGLLPHLQEGDRIPRTCAVFRDPRFQVRRAIGKNHLKAAASSQSPRSYRLLKGVSRRATAR